jgi:hypothetical protein
MPRVYCSWKYCKSNSEGECSRDEIELTDIDGTDEYGDDLYALTCEQFTRRNG